MQFYYDGRRQLQPLVRRPESDRADTMRPTMKRTACCAYGPAVRWKEVVGPGGCPFSAILPASVSAVTVASNVTS